MVDSKKRQTLQLVGTATTALAGLGVGSTTTAKRSKMPTSTLFSTGLMTGKEVVPPVKSPGKGIAAFVPRWEQKRIDYALVFHNLKQTLNGVKLSLGSKGENGPIVVDLMQSASEQSKALDGTGAVIVGSITMDDLAQVKALGDVTRKFWEKDAYVEVQSSAHPEGEIRSQVCAVRKLDVDFKMNVKVDASDEFELDYSTDLKVKLKEARRPKDDC
ncbi:CHRD domain-containing protein [Haladaptatus cibarius]|uniref:CHRD domain-containing protein n=1 Tax=Haladaptatus cibarius TaxID=453847 RepID=UPI000678F3F5|nr:CHRD domain-containing protein [Haladaptatus cibarius]